jgi:hypothetical protein
LGFKLCPAEVGPALRLNYLDQPLGEFLHIAMKPVARYTGEPVDFTIGIGGAGLLLLGGNGHPEATVPGAVRFVCVRPRADPLGNALINAASAPAAAHAPSPATLPRRLAPR